MRMREFCDAFVNRVGSADTKDENCCYERPKEPFFPKAEWMFARRWSFIKSKTQ
jgi:hypothetical protein